MRNLSKYIDIVFCVVVLPIMLLMFPIERWFEKLPLYPFLLVFWLYSLYFLNRLITVPSLFKGSKGQIRATVVILLSLVVTSFFANLEIFRPPHRFHDDIVRILPLFKPHQQAVWSLFMIVEAFSFAVGLLIQTEIQRARRLAVEGQRNRAELELYKARIKPHFMFNTLNSLYGLFLTGSDKALPSLEKFISLTKYLYTAAQESYVNIGREVEYIGEYVGLQGLRLNEKTGVDLNIDLKDPSLRIPPMILVTFVENCFKHGVSPVESGKIEINIYEKDGLLVFRTRNRVFKAERIGEHLGIENCRKRLDLCYPGSYSLEIKQKEESGIKYFEVELRLSLI